jgi:hypothetical protein
MEIVALRGFTNIHLKGYRFKIGVQGIIGHVSEAGNITTRPTFAPIFTMS